MIVSPIEQVTMTSGKKKRKRGLKAALKNFQTFQKILKNHKEEIKEQDKY